MTIEPDALLGPAAVDAAVAALAERNRHHLDSMAPDEREDAIGHWHDLALEVLTATRAALADGHDTPAAEGSPGRAVIVLEDTGGDDVAVHATFFPELEDVGPDEVAGTPAQIMALSVLDALAEEGDDGDEP